MCYHSIIRFVNKCHAHACKRRAVCVWFLTICALHCTGMQPQACGLIEMLNLCFLQTKSFLLCDRKKIICIFKIWIYQYSPTLGSVLHKHAHIHVIYKEPMLFLYQYMWCRVTEAQTLNCTHCSSLALDSQLPGT